MEPITLKQKIEKVVSQLKELSKEYNLKKLNLEVVLHDESKNEDFTFKLNEKHDILMSRKSTEPETSDVISEGRTIRTMTSDNTLSTSIFHNTEGETERFDDTESAKSAKSELQGGFLNFKTQNLSNEFSATSDIKVGGGFNNQFSATSMSATSDVKVGGGFNNQFSATSELNTVLRGGFNDMGYSETSQMSANSHSFNNMDTIRQKLRELENTSNKNIFQKKSQQGGSNKFAQIKQAIGINSSSTDSLCE